jgi:hypothetical protein
MSRHVIYVEGEVFGVGITILKGPQSRCRHSVKIRREVFGHVTKKMAVRQREV